MKICSISAFLLPKKVISKKRDLVIFFFLLHCGFGAYNHLRQSQKEGLIKVYEKRPVVKEERKLSNFSFDEGG